MRLKNKFIKDLKKIKIKSQDLGTRVRTDKILSEVEKAQFYSSWIYSATRQLSSVSRFQNRAQLSEAFGLRADEMNRVIDFLVTTGLCVESGNHVKIGPNKTHLESQSPFIFNHHKNWRLKGFEKHNNLSANDLMYTAPFTVSQKDFLLFREKLVQLIEQLVKMAGDTQSELLACFNADLFVLQ